MYQMTPEDLEIRARARAFVNDLIPYEANAELDEGELRPTSRPP